MKEKQYNQNDRVYFQLGENLPSGWGKIVGNQGLIYIIELEKLIPSYSFTHIYIIDNQIIEPPKL